jgi:hypothetical protein
MLTYHMGECGMYISLIGLEVWLFILPYSVRLLKLTNYCVYDCAITTVCYYDCVLYDCVEPMAADALPIFRYGQLTSYAGLPTLFVCHHGQLQYKEVSPNRINR